MKKEQQQTEKKLNKNLTKPTERRKRKICILVPQFLIVAMGENL